MFSRIASPGCHRGNFKRFRGSRDSRSSKCNDHCGEWNPGWGVYPTYIQLIDTLKNKRCLRMAPDRVPPIFLSTSLWFSYRKDYDHLIAFRVCSVFVGTNNDLPK